jgi:hypothetical protein
LQRVLSEITVFDKAAGARWDLQRLIKLWRHAHQSGSNNLGANAGQTGIPVPFKPLSAPRIGDEGAAFTATWGGDEFAYTGTVFIFRQGRYMALIETIGIIGQYHGSTALALARSIDRRIASAA